MPVNTKIQLRRGTAASWTTQVLSQGEIGFETDTGLFKIGDGTTAWNSLTYAAVKNVTAGDGLSVTSTSGNYIISLSDPTIQSTDITDFLEAVQDVIGNSGVISGFGSSKSYDDGTGYTTISITGMTNALSAGSGGIFLSSSSVSNNTAYTIHLTGVQPSNIVGVTATATELNYTDVSSVGTAEATKALVTDSSKNIAGINNLSTTGTINASTIQTSSNVRVTGNLTVNGTVSTTGNVTVGGDLIVNGSTVTVNSTTVTIDDPIFTLGGDTAGINDNKDRGIEFKYNNGIASTGFFGYSDSVDSFVFITGATSTSGEVFVGPYGPIRVGSATVTGTMTANAIAVTSTGVVSNLNADRLDGLDSTYFTDFSNITTNRPSPVVSVNLTGDVTGSGQATLTNLNTNASISFATTIPASSIVLGTDTTGQYASTITAAGSGLSATSANANGSTAYTITSNASASSGNGTIVLRDSAGSFSAGNVTANSFIKAGGTSSQFLKGDGSVDTNTYATSSSIGNGTLTLNVSGSGLSGSQTFTANQSSPATFTVTSNASSATGVGTLVLRDASGGFSAGAITATSFSGDGSSLTSLNASQLTAGTVPSARLDPNVVVFTTGTQSISGSKTFTNSTTFSSGLTSTRGVTIAPTSLGVALNIVDASGTAIAIVQGSDNKFVVRNDGYLGIGSSVSDVTTASFAVDNLGNINGGTWNATTIAVNKGGTGRTSYSNGQLLIGSGTSLTANTLTAGTGLSITNGSGTITINNILASTTATGIATFSSTNFAVDAAAQVTIKSGGVSNSNLANSSVTIGSTSVSLGSTSTAVTGLTSLAATNFFGGGANITSLNASNINAGTIAVSYLPTNIPITNLASSGITFGSTFQALGTTVSTLAGLTAISGTSAGSPTTLTNCVIDGGSP